MENALYIHSFSVLLTNGSKPAERIGFEAILKIISPYIFP